MFGWGKCYLGHMWMVVGAVLSLGICGWWWGQCFPWAYVDGGGGSAFLGPRYPDELGDARDDAARLLVERAPEGQMPGAFLDQGGAH
eukprot:scaffold1223_cov136-Isochrysis_galbana.AAC.7